MREGGPLRREIGSEIWSKRVEGSGRERLLGERLMASESSFVDSDEGRRNFHLNSN